MDDSVGERFGDYHLTQLLGKGNFGDVYLGEHIKNKKQAAIKVLHAKLTSKDDLKEYINELRTLFRLEHPNIVRLRDFGIEKDFPYLVMDYIPNGRLRQPRGTRLPLDIVISYVKQIAEALQFAHDQGILHRDVKPDNILLGSNSRVWLSDFGIAAVAHSTNSLNNQGNAGTLAYMAPEQIQGKPVKASDQYSLGIMAYEWICGTRPFNGTSSEIYNQHLLTDPPSMREYVPALSSLIEEVVIKTLAKDPKQRFASVRAFANALEQAYQASLIPEPEPTPALTKPLEQTASQQPAMSIETGQLQVRTQQPVQQSDRVVIVVPPLVASDNVNTAQDAPAPPATTFPQRQQGKHRRRWLFIAVAAALIAFLIAGFIFEATGGFVNAGSVVASTTVTITPDHSTVSDSFVVTAVTGKPNPAAQQVQARVVSYMSSPQSASAPATGSIAGANATGTLRFINISGSNISLGGGTLTGADGVRVSFGFVVVPVGSIDVTGTAVNQGVNGDIAAFDINGTCCGNSNILVKDPFGFSGGRNPIPNSVITQNDINTASNNLIATLKPSAQAALQGQLHPNEAAVSSSLTCTTNVTANHKVGDQAPSVTVTGTATCTEVVYDQKSALTIATNALKAEAARNPGAAYALAGKVVTSITSATVINKQNTVSLVILAQGVWVYQFTDALKTSLKNKIAKEPESKAQADINGIRGVMSATISISSGNTMPDAANITINIVQIPDLRVSPTPASISTPSQTTPTSTPGTTPTNGLSNGTTVTPTAGLAGS